MCLYDFRYQGIWQPDSSAREAELFSVKMHRWSSGSILQQAQSTPKQVCGLAVSFRGSHHQRPIFWRLPQLKLPWLLFQTVRYRVYLWGRGYEAGPALAAPGLSLLAVAVLVRRVQCREDLLLLSSEQFHGSRFLSPGQDRKSVV